MSASDPALDPTTVLVERMWQRFQPLASARVAVLEQYSTGTGPDAELRAQAEAAAHNLEGSLGTYGRADGSELAADYAALLRSGRGELADLRRLSERLRAVVGP